MRPADPADVVLEERPISVRMPEGVYPGTARRYRRKTTRGTLSKGVSVRVEMRVGVPFPGKWGDDAVYSLSTGGTPDCAIDAVVAKLRTGVMRDRPRGWRPSAKHLAMVRRDGARRAETDG